MKFVKANYEHKQSYLDKIAWVKNATEEPRAYFGEYPTSQIGRAHVSTPVT